ncbi:MAG: hypothetical protein IJF28_03100, partial [Firmicutes bacterium]|nr:hypothetical protein [Bacillota bacterium]
MNPVKSVEKKLDRCVRLLEELNMQVRDLRRQNPGQVPLCAETRGTSQVEKKDMPLVKSESEKDLSAAITEMKKEAFTETGKPEAPVREEKSGYNVDKFGRLYTEEEI